MRLLVPLLLLAQSGSPTPPSAPLAANAPFTVAVNTSTIEGAAAYVADHGPLGSGFTVINGGVRNLSNNSAHAATNAETQMLIVGNPKVRLLLTVAEGVYRIVAKRSAGIRQASDLRGKRITVPRNTSAHYFLVRALATAGIAESDVTLVDLPRDQMAAGLIKGQADAIVMWEPEAQKAVEALAQNALVFPNDGRYRELFSLYSTTDVLSDARRRKELVQLVHAVIVATDELKTNPQPHLPLIAKTVGQPEDLVARSWTHHVFRADLPSDLLDVMVEEDVWIARNQKRAPRTRAMLAALIDASVLADARSLSR